MIDWDDYQTNPLRPPTPEQAALAKALWEPLTEEEVKRAARLVGGSVPSQEEYYMLQRDLLRANRRWRRALRLHYWHLRYLLRRGWSRLLEPWADERRRQQTAEYIKYLEARSAVDDDAE